MDLACTLPATRCLGGLHSIQGALADEQCLHGNSRQIKIFLSYFSRCHPDGTSIVSVDAQCTRHYCWKAEKAQVILEAEHRQEQRGCICAQVSYLQQSKAEVEASSQQSRAELEASLQHSADQLAVQEAHVQALQAGSFSWLLPDAVKHAASLNTALQKYFAGLSFASHKCSFLRTDVLLHHVQFTAPANRHCSSMLNYRASSVFTRRLRHCASLNLSPHVRLQSQTRQGEEAAAEAARQARQLQSAGAAREAELLQQVS